MSDPQFKCQYQSHKEESVIAVCVNIACNQPRLCCFLCMQEAYHDQHRKEILKIQQLNNWKQDGVKIIDAIKMIISEQENMISLLKQLVLENQNAVDVNIGYATATKIEDAINQINKLRKIDSILQTDLDQLSGQIKKKLKELKSQIVNG